MASPTNPDLYKPVSSWLMANQGFYSRFRHWLREGGYGQSALHIYSCAVRLAISQLDKAYWQITDEDLCQIRTLLAERFPSEGTRHGYDKGLRKLAEYLRQRQGKPQIQKQVNWPYFLAGVPDEIGAFVKGYLRHCRRGWRPDAIYPLSSQAAGVLTRFLRWASTQTTLHSPADLNPALWFAYLDLRLAEGIQPVTVNKELHAVQNWCRYLEELGVPTCERLLLLERLPEKGRLPKDAAVDQLRLLAAEIESDAASGHRGTRRMGIMDRAWFRLMLHCGLRVGEVRRLGLEDYDLADLRLRIEQSKGLKDRVVFMSRETAEAIAAYLSVRGPMDSGHLFVYRHQPLSATYCSQRLRTWGRRCGVMLTPHQLRHSCATLLLNAGTPILTIQALLGHKYLHTTLSYARLYDSTVAADYYRAMAMVEQQMGLMQEGEQPLPTKGELVAMVDALSQGTLKEQQRELVHTLRQSQLSLPAPSAVSNGHG